MVKRVFCQEPKLSTNHSHNKTLCLACVSVTQWLAKQFFSNLLGVQSETPRKNRNRRGRPPDRQFCASIVRRAGRERREISSKKISYLLVFPSVTFAFSAVIFWTGFSTGLLEEICNSVRSYVDFLGGDDLDSTKTEVVEIAYRALRVAR